MRTFLLLMGLAILAAVAAPVVAQMSPQEAQAWLDQRAAARAAAATQPSAEDVAYLKSTIHLMKDKLDSLEKENSHLRCLVPEIPRAGWNFGRLTNVNYAKTLATGVVFNINSQGKLVQGTAGERASEVSVVQTTRFDRAAGIVPDTKQIQTQMDQVALYNVFVNNGTPYDPTYSRRCPARS